MLAVGAGLLAAIWMTSPAVGFVVMTAGWQPMHARQEQVPAIPRQTRFQVCIMPAAGAIVDEVQARTAVEAGLQAVTTHPAWPVVGFTEPAVVDFGCGVEPVLLKPDVVLSSFTPEYASRPDESPAQVTQRGPYNLYFFVLPEPELVRIFKQRMLEDRHAAQELTCRREGQPPRMETLCFHLSTGLYLNPDQIADSSIVHDVIVSLYHLDRLRDAKPEDFSR